MIEEEKYPSQTIDLPSRGWYYLESSPLSKGQLDLKYMTAKEENILSSQNLIEKGVVYDRLLESLITTEGVNYNDLLIGDKNGIMIAARILGYGPEYSLGELTCRCGAKEEVVVDLRKLEFKEVDFKDENKGRNEFEFELPITKQKIIFKLLTHLDEQEINSEVTGLKKMDRTGIDPELTVRLQHSILSVNGDSKKDIIRKFVDNLLARDSLAFRDRVKSLNPDIDMNYEHICTVCKEGRRLMVPITLNFFWPDK